MSIIPCNRSFLYCFQESDWHTAFSSLQWCGFFDSWCRWLWCGLLLSASQEELSPILSVCSTRRRTSGSRLRMPISTAPRADIDFDICLQMGFLTNLVKVFPNLQKRPLYLTGESYAGMYIVGPTPNTLDGIELNSRVSYRNLSSHTSWRPISTRPIPPFKSVRSLSVTDQYLHLKYLSTCPLWVLLWYTWNLPDTMNLASNFANISSAYWIRSTSLQILRSSVRPTLCRTSSSSHYFSTITITRSHLCQYDVNLTYPQTSLLPSIPLINPTQRDLPFLASKLSARTFLRQLYRRGAEKRYELVRRGGSDFVKRDSSQFFKNRPFDQLDPWVRILVLEWND